MSAAEATTTAPTSNNNNTSLDEFYVRYYVGHKGIFGHEFLQFEFHSNGRLLYSNNTNYKKDGMIQKEMFVNECVLQQVRRMIDDSGIMKHDDAQWPEPSRTGKQELEVVLGNEHIAFATAKIGTLVEVTKCKDAEGLKNFYYIVQDLKSLVLSLVTLHFKIKPI